MKETRKEDIAETLTDDRRPLAHHTHLTSANMLERVNQEIQRRTHVVRLFPYAARCWRLVRARTVESHQEWLEATRDRNLEHLKEHKKERLRALPAAA